MRVEVNMDRINEIGLARIQEAGPAAAAYWSSDGALMRVKLKSGSILLAAPCSSINRLAPPTIWISGRRDLEINNRRRSDTIVRRLRPSCRSKYLLGAVKMMKAAIEQISK